MALKLSQKQEVVAELAEVAAQGPLAGCCRVRRHHGRPNDRDAQEGPGVRRVLESSQEYAGFARRRGTEYECVKDALIGPLLYAFSEEDPGAAGRLIKEFSKGNDKLQAKVVSIGGKL